MQESLEADRQNYQRRRQCPQSTDGESPLDSHRDGTVIYPKYETFPPSTYPSSRKIGAEERYFEMGVLCRLLRIRSAGCEDDQAPTDTFIQKHLSCSRSASCFSGRSLWNPLPAILVLLALLVFQRSIGPLADKPYDVGQADWYWDHNAYRTLPNRRNGTKTATVWDQMDGSTTEDDDGPRRLLIVQTTGGRTMAELAAVASRINRAYARQFRVDYAQVSTQTHSMRRTCVEKAYALQEIANQQSNQHPNSLVLATKDQRPRAEYHVVAILPPNAVLIDLDYDLLELSPPESLVSLATLGSVFGLDAGNAGNGGVDTAQRRWAEVIIFNLRHKDALEVAALWWEQLMSRRLTCGSGREFELLIELILSVAHERESLTNLIYTLNETDDGLIGKDGVWVLKETALQVAPSPQTHVVMYASNLADARASLQSDVDSVCYRYYPRCEML
jgi:hypothetical protein